MLQLLVVTEGVTPFLYACWDDCMDYFILWNGRWYDKWYDEAWNNALLCILSPWAASKAFWWTQKQKQICSAREHEFAEPLPQRNYRQTLSLTVLSDGRAPARVQCQKKWSSCLTPCLEEEETGNSPTGKESGLVLPALPYLFGDSMLVDSALQLLQLCSNGSELCCPHCLTQDLPTVPATSNPWLV